MTGFAALRKNKANALAGLQQKVQAAASADGGGGNKDPRKWKITYNKDTKIGSAVIRFLPFGGGERLPWAEWAEFSFKGKGGNYWERSRKSIGEEDPVAEMNHLQWERNQGDDQDQVRKRGRRLRYVSNIVVVSDPAHPENNGKVFLFEYGPAIHKKIIAAMVPEYADQSPVQIFDMWEGATFRLRTKDKSGYLNYDDSTFDAPSLLHKDDKILEGFYDGMHDVAEFENLDLYKSFDDLDKQMRKVLGGAYVASVLGEEFNPANAAAAGGNPFPQGGQQQANTNQKPAGTKSAPKETNTDPFADSGNDAPADNSDPFANQGNDAPADNSDPFGDLNQSGAADGDDPFGDLDL